MRVISVNVGRPRTISWRGREITTSIWKSPVSGRVAVRRLNLDGDQQSDLTVHGGVDKAVYAYPSEHYPAWRSELASPALDWGSFGENLTTEGLSETALAIGDRIGAGSALFVVTQPRMPCYKLSARFERDDMGRLMLKSGRSGFYLAVLTEGTIGAGDEIVIEPVEGERLTVAEVTALYASESRDRGLLEKAARTAALPESWREHFQSLLDPAR